MQVVQESRSSLRAKANNAKKYKCKTLICVLEYPANSGNIGAVIRNIDALGVGKLYIITDHPRQWDSIRKDRHLRSSSASANKWVYVRCFPTTQECIKYLQKKNFDILVTSPHIKGHNNYTLIEYPDYTCQKLAIFFGNETKGISGEAVQNAKACIQIPMCGIIESMNLSVTTGIVLHHITTIRRAYKQEKLIRK